MALEVCIQKKLGAMQLDVEFCAENEVFTILGASGCGKSMTLKCIAGIEKPDSGKIIVNNKVFFDSKNRINLSPQERKVGYLFQDYALFPNMTTEENIGISLNVSKEEKKKIVLEQMERFHLENLGERYPSQLSGGQKQRVALARIFAYRPDIIMLDEPFSALDSFLKDKLKQQMKDTLREYDGDVILVSHSRDEVYRFCDNLLIMNKGNIILQGNTKEIFINPIKKEAARLTGCKNISKATKINDYSVFAQDWNLELKTEEKVDDSIKYVGIRAHDLVGMDNKIEENTFEISYVNQMETPFEIEYLIINVSSVGYNELNMSKIDDYKKIWWKVSKESSSAIIKNKYVCLPKHKLMLLS